MPNLPEPGRNITIAAWLALAVMSCAIILTQFSMSVDLAYFLPAPSTEQEHVLLDRLGQGPGSQLMFVTVRGRDREEVLNKSDRLADALRTSALFTNVLNGQEELTRASIPAVVWDNRYLLADIDATATGLRQTLHARLADLAVFSGSDFSDMIAADPHLAAITVMENLSGSNLATIPDWLGTDGQSAFLITAVDAPAFDIEGQAAAVEFIRTAATEAGATPVELNGFGVYGVELQRTIRSEAQLRSIFASLAIVLVLLVAYRSVRITLLAVVPLALGALAGIAAVALCFDEIHGITLAFGFTLFGVAVDYPLHFFSHCRHQRPHDAIRAVWPTLRLGAISTIIAYLSISVSGSRGLAQLGILSAIGILVAMAATRSLLPILIADNAVPRDAGPNAGSREIRPTLRHLVWIGVCAVSVAAIAWQGPIWSNDLSTLTPIDPAKLRHDNELRAALGAPDIRYLVSLRAPTEQEALQVTEALASHLDNARSDGLIDDYRVATTLLPSRRTQQRRQAALTTGLDPVVAIHEAVDGTPFRPDGFTPFATALKKVAGQKPLTAADFDGSPLSGYVDAHLYFDGNDWVSLATLFNLTEPARLKDRLGQAMPDATLVDLKSASMELVLNYRQRIQLVLFGAVALILFVLVWRVGFSARLIWIAGTLSAAVLGTIAINAMLLAQLSIFNLIALLLVAGLGLDYALFISRTEVDLRQAGQTRHAVRVCFTSTLVAFLILAWSSVPILASLGTTVATGVLLNYALAKIGSINAGAG